MFQLFLRARADNFFRTRSGRRDSETDHERVASIARSIESAISAAEAEWTGLNARINDVLARAAVTSGNGDDEYLTRDSVEKHHQNLFDAEIINGQQRLAALSESIKHFKFLRAVLSTRFPDFKESAPAQPH